MKIEGNLRVIQKVLIRNHDKFLLVQRASDDRNYPNKWEFPGGKIDWGEKPEKAAIREVIEETGIRLSTVELSGAVALFTKFFRRRHNISIQYQSN